MKTILRHITWLIITTNSFYLSAQNTTSVYVVPHPDDWQLFMNPNAYKSVKNDEKVIFIHTTAGDGGAGASDNYYLAREEGSLRAIRFMSNTFTSGAGLGTNMNETAVTINGHSIKKFTYRNAVAYFLRLPDGNIDGSGYSYTNLETLKKLYEGTISSISAVDGSTTYNSLNDLIETLKSLLEIEYYNPSNMIFNSADDDTSINPGDHSDHIFSSKIIQDVANTMPNVNAIKNLYIDYHTASLPQNVFGDDYLVSAGTWGTTASGLSDNYQNSTWQADHNVWIGKQYFRTLTISPTDTYTVTVSESYLNDATPQNSGTVTPDSKQYATGTTVTIANDFTNIGDHFVGFHYDAAGTNPVTSFNITSDTTIYAVYDIAKAVTVSVAESYLNDATSQNSGSVSPDSVQVESGTNITLSSYFTNTGNNFKGFYSDAKGTMPISSLTATSDTTVYAVYNYVITFNIALNKPTSCSSYEGGHSSSHAVDGINSLSSWWGANPYPQWWQVDLQDLYDINKIVVTNYYDGTRYYQYDIQASADGTNWSPLVDFNNNTTPAAKQGNTFIINNSTARFLRVNMNFNSANIGVHIIEFEAYGTLSTTNYHMVTVSESYLNDATPQNSGAVTPDSKQYASGTTVTIANDFTNIGDHFVGFHYDAAGTNPVTSFNITSDTTIYAVYDIAKAVTVSVAESYLNDATSQNSGSVSPDSVQVESGTNITLSSYFTNTGNNFKGFYSDAKGTMPISSLTATSDTTVYAVYNYVITFNIALNKPTSCSSYEGGHSSSHAVDGINSLSSWWGANPYPQWWQVDLQDLYDINKIVVTNYYDGTRYYQYDIQASADGTNWSPLVDFNNNTTPAAKQGNTFIINNSTARFLRVNMNYNSANIGVHIIEFEAYGTLSTAGSSIKSISIVENTSALIDEDLNLLVYPNPVNTSDDLTLEFNSTDQALAIVNTYTIAGKKVFETSFITTEGKNLFNIEGSVFPIGTNIITLTIENKTISKQIHVM